MSLGKKGQESRQRKDQDQGQERTRQSQETERNSAINKVKKIKARPNYDLFIGTTNMRN